MPNRFMPRISNNNTQDNTLRLGHEMRDHSVSSKICLQTLKEERVGASQYRPLGNMCNHKKRKGKKRKELHASKMNFRTGIEHRACRNKAKRISELRDTCTLLNRKRFYPCLLSNRSHSYRRFLNMKTSIILYILKIVC